MTVRDIVEKNNFLVFAGDKGLEREVESVYCCDLLSFAMSKAPMDSAWITVINNINAIAVASLTDVSCIVLCEGVKPDTQATQKANEQDIAVLTSEFAAFETAKMIYDSFS